MQLIPAPPFGGRINKAWGLGFAKALLRGFNYELQAAATDNGIKISVLRSSTVPTAMSFTF